MLFDWLDRLLTRCPLHLREMGYKRELFGIRRRWREWGSAWQSHCANTRRIILAAASRCRQRRLAVLFGTGFLHDIPLDELSREFTRVVLVDLIHPFSIRQRVKRLGNVELLSADVSETVEAVWLAVERPGASLPTSNPHLFLEDEVDLTASVNLLSQLPCMPEHYLKQWYSHRPNEITAYCRGVVEAHLKYLQALPGVVALIADIEAQTVTQTGQVLSRRSTLYGAEFPFRGETWIWPILPRKPRTPQLGEHLLVMGLEDIKREKPREGK